MRVERETAAPGRTDRPIDKARDPRRVERSLPRPDQLGPAERGVSAPCQRSDRPRSLGQGADAPRSPRPARRDTGHGAARHGTTRHGTARDKKGLPSATWGFSQGLGHRWLESARSLCCPQRDKRARNPSFLLKNSQDFSEWPRFLSSASSQVRGVTFLSMSTSDETMTSLRRVGRAGGVSPLSSRPDRGLTPPARTGPTSANPEPPIADRGLTPIPLNQQ